MTTSEPRPPLLDSAIYSLSEHDTLIPSFEDGVSLFRLHFPNPLLLYPNPRSLSFCCCVIMNDTLAVVLSTSGDATGS